MRRLRGSSEQHARRENFSQPADQSSSHSESSAAVRTFSWPVHLASKLITYDTSIKVAEHELLTQVRKLPNDTLLIADGFSCREQVRQTTGCMPLHIAQVLQMAQQADRGTEGDCL